MPYIFLSQKGKFESAPPRVEWRLIDEGGGFGYLETVTVRTENIVDTNPVIALSQWEFIFEPLSGKGRDSQIAIVIFEIPDNCYPIDLFYILSKEELNDWESFTIEEIEVLNSEQLQFWKESGQGEKEFIGYRMKTDKDVRAVLHFLIKKGWTPLYRDDERLEIVVRTNITADNIKKVIPLYSTNKDFKEKKEKFRDDWD